MKKQLNNPDAIVERLAAGEALTREEFEALARGWQALDGEKLRALALAARQRSYGRDVYLRGLVEISNHCKNDCFYCGIRKSNAAAARYRLSPEEILDCCQRGYALGLRTFVLQGGEDPWFTDQRLCSLIKTIKERWPGVAVTLSLGERSRESYAALRRAGADRYLLRHESADPAHYAALHPGGMALQSRVDCLFALKDLGYQVGAGFMVGTPGQSAATLAEDLLLLQRLAPEMVGIGPFLPHADTPFGGEAPGSAEQTLVLLSLVRLLLPGALLPATTALGTLAADGWERGLAAGANVIMPNLTPPEAREKYELYNGKNPTPAEELAQLCRRVEAAGFAVSFSRGDHIQGDRH